MGSVRFDGCSQSGRWLCRDVGTLFVGTGELAIFARKSVDFSLFCTKSKLVLEAGKYEETVNLKWSSLNFDGVSTLSAQTDVLPLLRLSAKWLQQESVDFSPSNKMHFEPPCALKSC